MIHKQRLFNERGGEKGIPIREEFQRWYVMPGNKSSMQREQLPPWGPHKRNRWEAGVQWAGWVENKAFMRPHLSYNTALIKEGADAHRSSRRHGAVSNSLSARPHTTASVVPCYVAPRWDCDGTLWCKGTPSHGTSIINSYLFDYRFYFGAKKCLDG